jgi:hypothetical protein
LATVMRHLLATLQPADAACFEPAVEAARTSTAARAEATAETSAAGGAGAGDSAAAAARPAPAASTARAPPSAATRSRAARGARSNVAEFADDEEGEELLKLAASASFSAGKLSAHGAATAAAALHSCEEGPGTLNVAETPDGCSASGVADGYNTSEGSEGYTTNAPEVAEGFCTNAPETPHTAVHTTGGMLSVNKAPAE